ncbi:MAG: glycosyltransferase [Nitrospiraceae bacterium]|nr:glycosyltransferase [Nitrospiraceae bacterium]
MSKELVSVVICTYNRADSLRLAIESVTAQRTGARLDYEVVVVDDGSTDDTREAVEEARAKAPVPVHYVLEEGCGGIAAARNRGIAESHNDWIAFFDDDQLAEPEWLANLLSTAQTLDVSCVGGPRRLDLPPEDLARLGPRCRAMLGEELYGEEPVPFDGERLPTTGNLMIHRRVLDEVSGFDANMSISSGEDADLLLRARAAGFAIWMAPTAMVTHMIPRYRLNRAYFRWVSMRWGVNLAKMHLKRKSWATMAVLCLARLIQAFAINLPTLAWTSARGDAPRALDLRCSIWRAQAYARQTLAALAPRLFAQASFFDQLDFRKEREKFSEDATPMEGLASSE